MSDASPPTTPPPARSARRALAIRFAAFARWLHIYLSMFGLASVLFFGATGLTLNHPDWFLAGAERQSEAEGTIDPNWLDGPDEQIDRLDVVEHLRSAHGVSGALSEFRADEFECSVAFRGPGYSADAFIDRATGRYRLTQLHQGAVAVLNDLHKGRDTGPVWSVVVDVSAVVLVLISLTGLILLFFLKLRRRPGLAVGLIGTVVLVVLYWLGVG